MKIISKGVDIELPSFTDQVRSFKNKLCIFGSVCEGYEAIWRIHGTENSLMNMILKKKLKELVIL